MSNQNRISSLVFTVMALQLILSPNYYTLSFHISPMPIRHGSTQLGAVSEDEISKQLDRARELLAKSKAKIEAKEQESFEELTNDDKNFANGKENVPFFASKTAPFDENKKKEKVIKSKNEEGLFTTDGEMMAALSESEEWQVRPLQEVFENEEKEKSDDPFADRDVAASIFNLRKTLQTEDYKKIFDQRNRFIGEQ